MASKSKRTGQKSREGIATSIHGALTYFSAFIAAGALLVRDQSGGLRPFLNAA
jgi:hypothetical protein